MKERIIEIDMIKGFFIVCVIFLHTMIFTGVNQLYIEFANYFGSFILLQWLVFVFYLDIRTVRESLI